MRISDWSSDVCSSDLLQKITIGEYDGSHSERVQALVTSFASTGIDAQASSDIERTLWEKYVFLVGLSATTALTRMPIGMVRQTPDTRDLLHKIIEIGRAASGERVGQ